MKTTGTYYAHSCDTLPENEWQLLADHLKSVGKMARGNAEHFDAADWGELAGLLHDLGKYCPEFQARLRGSKARVDHATWGAHIVKEKYKERCQGIVGKLLAYGIAGHHTGLADGRELSDPQKITPLANRLRKTPETCLDEQWQSEINIKESPALPSMKFAEGMQCFQLSMLGRMLYSCLVDADFLDTDAFYRQAENRPAREENFPPLVTLQERLNNYLAQPRFQSRTGVNKIRAEILTHVRQCAELEEPGLFSLNVPTGGGKTLSSLAFALDHAIRHGKRRVIFVIPFTSIIEQNAQVFRDALGEDSVLEHHSAFNDDPKGKGQGKTNDNPDSRDKLRQASENWNAPIIVTTAVQFFESLFANRSSRCRKLHNIANSVVILDEAQTLPYKLLAPCVATIAELARNYKTSLVLCTATQPALLAAKDGFDNGLTNVRELAPNPPNLHQALERVIVKHIGSLNDAELVERLTLHDQVLCIVNNRRHARALYEQIRCLPGSYHLTTLMCAQHRSDKLEEIRQTLKVGMPCRVISTSLIEAGVDVDFPAVYRAEAGLDSIAQAAGRCNREGKSSKSESILAVFEVAGDWSMPPELEQYAQACRTIFRQHPDNPLSLEAIQAYFKEVYWLKGKQLDAYRLLEKIESGGVDGIPYEQLSYKFCMIENDMRPVIVTYDSKSQTEKHGESARLLDGLRHAPYIGNIARKLQRYIVQVPEYGLKALRDAGAVSPVQEERFGEQFLELVATYLYDQDCGLSWDNPEFIAADKLVI